MQSRGNVFGMEAKAILNDVTIGSENVRETKL